MNKIKESSLSILEISKKTGISHQRLYKFKDGKTAGKLEDMIILDKFFNSDLSKKGNDVSLSEHETQQQKIEYLMRKLDMVQANLDSVLQAQYAHLAHQKALAWYLAKTQAGADPQALKGELEKINNKVAEYAGVVPAKGKKVSS